MDIYEQLPTLLKSEKHNDTIILRLDKSGLGNFVNEEKSVQEITLKGCNSIKNIVEELEEFVNQVFEYEVFRQNNKLIFQFRADYGRLESEFEFNELSENFSEYTTEDLLQKGYALYDLYVSLHKRFTKNEEINYQLREKLNFEIANELERSKRKAEFFEETKKAKSETFQSEVRFLQKLQKILK